MEYIKKHLYLLIPIITLFLSDSVLKIYHGFNLYFLYNLALNVTLILLIDFVIGSARFKRLITNTVVILSIVYAGTLSSYYSAFHTVFSFGNLGQADDMTGVVAIIPEYINLDTFLYVFLFIGYVYFYRKIEIPERKINREKFYPLILAVVVLLFSNYAILKSDLKEPILSHYGVHTYFAFDILDINQAPEEEMELSEIDDYISKKNYLESDNEYTKMFEGKNIVFVMVESLEDFVIDPYLPTLSKLKEEGMYFNNYYIPRYQAITADSEFIYNTSQVPLLRNGVTYRVYAENTYSISMVNKFEEKGYSSYYFHDYFGSFYHRKYALNNVGYDVTDFAEELELEIEPGMTEMPIDSDLIKSSFNKYKFQEPFITFYTTVSGHQKYERPSTLEYANQYKKQLEGMEYEEVFPYYLGAIRHSDDAIAELIVQLENANQLENTVLVITSDHMAKNAGNESYKFFDEDPHLSFKGPLIIWTPDMEAKKVDILASSFDVLPTIANMFGLDIDVNNYVGTDIFSENERFIPFYDRQWLTDSGYYCAPKLEYFAFDGKLSSLDRNNQRVLDMHRYGQAILYHNYFKVEND